VLAGFADPVLDAQRVFRSVLDAMAHPGHVVEVSAPESAPVPLHGAVASLCLTLVDLDTPVWLDGMAGTPETREYLQFHCGCRFVEAPGAARFALIGDPAVMPALSRFDAGTDESPERSATLLVQVPSLREGRGRRLAGAGIASEVRLEAIGLPAGFWHGLRDNHALFPRGVDVLLAAGRHVAALPRTTSVSD
jgi:alpha-D-ribose 1-methylphosphonate 5-triphosphate synthase subunit PhnH